MTWKIPLFKIYWDKDDIRLVNKAIRRGMFWAIGPNIDQFETDLAKYIGVQYAVALNSGTSALHAAVLACGLGPGDEVVVPSFTFIATANAALFVGARPVFADIEETTYGLDPSDVERKISPKTKAIIPVHYAGSSCRINELKEVARKHNLMLIEDAAEALGASVSGKMVGSFGDCAVLSFCSNKVITTGEGGAVVTNSREIYEKLKLVRSHGRAENANYFATNEYMDYVTLGYNFRMSDITAALGIAQLKKVGQIIAMRQERAEKLSERLSHIGHINVPSNPSNFVHVYQMYTIRVKDGKAVRDALMAFLAKEGIFSKVYFYPVHLTQFYRQKLGYNCHLPVTESLSDQALTLPLYPTISDQELDYISNAIAKFFS